MQKFILTLFLLISTSAFAASNCPQLYPTGHEIADPGTIELCNSFYVIRYDDAHHANIFSAEILQPSGHQVERLNNFHADTRTQSKVSPAHYNGTGFDRGHMVPAGDATNSAQMSETFLMTNMTPQAQTCNRNNWKLLEEHVRMEAGRANQPLHVLTMARYAPALKTMNGIPVPSGYFKIVYTNPIQAFYADNVDHCTVKQVNLSDVEQAAGFSLH